MISQDLTVLVEQPEVEVGVGKSPPPPGGKQRNNGPRMQGIHNGIGGKMQGIKWLSSSPVAVVVVPENVVSDPPDAVKVVGGMVIVVVNGPPETVGNV